MKGMTGFGYAEYRSENLEITAEVKSYNNRYLDIFVNLPSFLSPLEPSVREFVAPWLLRGRVEVYLRVLDRESEVSVNIDRPTLTAYRHALREMSEILGSGEEARLSHVMRLEGIMEVKRSRDLDDYWELVRPTLEQALSDFDASRAREGASTRADIVSQLERISGVVEELAGRAPELEDALRRTVTERFEEILGERADEERVYAEIASLLIKHSVNEELVRLRAHLKSFEETMSAQGAMGKKLDFFCQELNREVNTIASKSFVSDVNRRVVEAKDAVENIREQLRNVE
ncbi:MAG: YicC/YloC family endoribonuclease [Spirochaetaceae bacterium]